MKLDVILLDIGLPGLPGLPGMDGMDGMDGFEVARLLRGEGFHDVLIIAGSGYCEAQASEQSKASGIDHYLVKPLDFDALRGLIARRMQRRPALDHSSPRMETSARTARSVG